MAVSVSPLAHHIAPPTGFTDQFYKDLLVRYPPEGQPEKCSKVSPLAYVETGGYRPDVWFDPSEVLGFLLLYSTLGRIRR
jgi:hypothetical protein